MNDTLAGFPEDKISEFDIPEGARIGGVGTKAGDEWAMVLTYTHQDGRRFRIAGTEKRVPYRLCYTPGIDPKLNHFQTRLRKTGQKYKGDPLCGPRPKGGVRLVEPPPKEPPPLTEKPPNPIAGQLKVAEQMLRGCVQYRSPAGVIFSGAPGLGKSTVLRRIVEEYGMPWRPLRPSAAELVHVIRKYRARGNLLCFDDYDEVWSNREQLSVFKIVLDTQSERILSRDVRGPNRVPPFQVDCGIAFLSNKNFDDRGDFPPQIWSAHIPAIKDRCAIVTLSFERKHMIDYTLSIATDLLKAVRFKGGGLGDLLLSRAKACEVLEFVDKHLNRMPNLTPRLLEKLALTRLHPAYTDDWESVALRECGIA